MKKIALLSVIVGLFSGCGIPKEQHENILAENEKLKKELKSLKVEVGVLKKDVDEFKNGEARLVARINSAVKEKSFGTAKEAINRLRESHPESPKNEEFGRILENILKQEGEEKERQSKESAERARKAVEIEKERLAQLEKEKSEKERLAKINDTGMWAIGYYVDEFGNKTQNRYLTNKAPIVGVFSNSATENSPLKVDFLINSSSEIEIMLYEYARNNPVKVFRETSYRVAIQDRSGEKIEAEAVNRSDRLRLTRSSGAELLGDAMRKGGQVKIVITEGRPSNVYRFTIANAEGYENGLRLLEEARTAVKK